MIISEIVLQNRECIWKVQSGQQKAMEGIRTAQEGVKKARIGIEQLELGIQDHTLGEIEERINNIRTALKGLPRNRPGSPDHHIFHMLYSTIIFCIVIAVMSACFYGVLLS